MLETTASLSCLYQACPSWRKTTDGTPCRMTALRRHLGTPQMKTLITEINLAQVTPVAPFPFVEDVHTARFTIRDDLADGFPRTQSAAVEFNVTP